MILTDAVEDIGIVCGETKFSSSEPYALPKVRQHRINLTCILIPGENRQAGHRLDSCVDRPLVGRDSATPAQPASRWASRATITIR